MKVKQTFKNSFYALKIVFTYAPWVAGGYALFSLGGAVFTLLQVFFLQHLVDSVMGPELNQTAVIEHGYLIAKSTG